MQDTNELTNAHKFTDLHGREWSLVITVNEYRILKDEHGIDIGKVFDQERSWISQIVAQDDMILLPLVLRTLCDKQCKERSIDDQEFFEGLCGNTLSKATDALIQAVSNFTPVHKRQALQVIVDNLKRGMQAVTDKVIEREQEIRDRIDWEIADQIDKQLQSLPTSRSSSSKPQESAKSTPDLSASTS